MPGRLKNLNPERLSSAADKSEHVRLCLEGRMESDLTNGFERFRLVNNPLPELNYDDVDTTCRFLGKPMAAPFVISPMTGGSRVSEAINEHLATAAQHLGVALAVGSQRLALENPDLAATYQIRRFAPDIPVVANLGAVYLNYGYGLEECEQLVDMVGADALGLYINPMQKIMQGFEKLNFDGLLEKIADICQNLSVPVLVKEVGFGLDPVTARKLLQAGVHVLDVAGAGGTSWSKITRNMKKNESGDMGRCFDNWGTPTAKALMDVRQAVPEIPLIASGGIRSGLDMAKALALGADYAGMALPLLAPATRSAKAVASAIETVLTELKIAMFCCGVKTLADFRSGKQIIEPR